MIRAFLLSLGQLADPAILRIFLKSIGLTLVVFVALGAALWFGTQWLFVDKLGWGEDAAGLAIVGEFVATILFGWVLFRAARRRTARWSRRSSAGCAAPARRSTRSSSTASAARCPIARRTTSPPSPRRAPR